MVVLMPIIVPNEAINEVKRFTEVFYMSLKNTDIDKQSNVKQ